MTIREVSTIIACLTTQAIMISFSTHRTRMYICNTCSTTTKGHGSWTKHRRHDHQQNASATIYFMETIMDSLQQYNSKTKKRQHCEICQESQQSLFHHMEEVHKGRVFVCVDCKAEFKSYLDLPSHSMVVHGGNALFKQRYGTEEIKEYICHVCDEVVERSVQNLKFR